MIELHYEEDHPREWYVRGHVSDDVAIEDVRTALEHERDDDDPPVPPLGAVERTYARWGFDVNEHGELRSRRFKPFVPRRRGAFPVTVVRDLDHRQHEQDWQDRVNAGHQVLAALVRAHWPMATDLDVAKWPRLDPGVRFRLPELAGWVEARGMDLTTVTVEQRDVEAFILLYAGGA